MTTTSPHGAAGAEGALRDRAGKIADLVEAHEAALLALRKDRDELIREFRADTDLSIPAIADAARVSESTVKGALPREATPRRPGRRPGRSSR